MKIVVKGYTYQIDEDVKVGDKVVLPTASWLLDVLPPTWEGVVSAVTSDYDGPCAKAKKA